MPTVMWLDAAGRTEPMNVVPCAMPSWDLRLTRQVDDDDDDDDDDDGDDDDDDDDITV